MLLVASSLTTVPGQNGDTALHFAASKGLLEHLVIMSHDPNFLREVGRLPVCVS